MGLVLVFEDEILLDMFCYCKLSNVVYVFVRNNVKNAFLDPKIPGFRNDVITRKMVSPEVKSPIRTSAKKHGFMKKAISPMVSVFLVKTRLILF